MAGAAQICLLPAPFVASLLTVCPPFAFLCGLFVFPQTLENVSQLCPASGLATKHSDYFYCFGPLCLRWESRRGMIISHHLRLSSQFINVADGFGLLWSFNSPPACGALDVACFACSTAVGCKGMWYSPSLVRHPLSTGFADADIFVFVKSKIAAVSQVVFQMCELARIAELMSHPVGILKVLLDGLPVASSGSPGLPTYSGRRSRIGHRGWDAAILHGPYQLPLRRGQRWGRVVINQRDLLANLVSCSSNFVPRDVLFSSRTLLLPFPEYLSKF